MSGGTNSTDPFSRFWMDMVSKMAPPGMGGASYPSPSEEAMRQARQAFFDVWAKHCEEYLGSEAFLDMLRKSMDNALAFKQQVNEYLTKALHESQMPTREDTDSIMLVLRSMEERVLDRLGKLSQRVDTLEARLGEGGTAPPPGPVENRRRPVKGAPR